MKIHCDCGTKYSFDVTPEMASRPVQFVCQVCGLDSSVRVNELIRQEVAAMSAPAPVVAAPPPPAPVRTRVALARSAPQAEASTTTAAVADAGQLCIKHPGQVAVQRCYICQKPICPKCMEMFGYVCSPLCKAKAESHGINVPVYAGQRSVAERRLWRKVGLVAGGVTAFIVAFLGLWFWYAWFGSRPKPVFSVRFEHPVQSGKSQLVGKDQIVFLHGGTLSRYDLKTKQQIWSRDLIDKKRIADSVASEMKALSDARNRMFEQGADRVPRMPSAEEVQQELEDMAAAELALHIHDHNVWVASEGTLRRYDWDTGKPGQEISLDDSLGEMLDRGNELVFVNQTGFKQRAITHISLSTGQSQTEQIGEPGQILAGDDSTKAKDALVAAMLKSKGGGGLPLRPGADGTKPMDPAKVAEQAQRMSLPGKIALPAVLASSRHQEQVMSEINDQSDVRSAMHFTLQQSHDQSSFIPSPHGYVEFSARLLESRIVSRKAMKDPPRKSSLDGNVNASRTADVANEILNEMQRDRGGDTVEEDESRYQVTVSRPTQKEIADWTGEVIGPPQIVPLRTVDVIAAGKSITVIDKTNKKKWEAALTYRVPERSPFGDDDESVTGAGPCVERGDTLYVFDQAVLTAFDLANGQARWRLPLVGVSGLFFDDKGNVYANATTASPDSIKYSNQIDVNRKSGPLIVKVDPKHGKILWRTAAAGPIRYLSGKFIYTMSSFQSDEGLAENSLTAILTQPSYLKIRRINPSSGGIMWEHFQQRCPVNVHFEGNSIDLVFRKEVQVLRFLSL